MPQNKAKNIEKNENNSIRALIVVRTVLWPLLICLVCVWQLLDRDSIQERKFILPIIAVLVLVATLEIYNSFINDDWLCICMNVAAIIWYVHILLKFIFKKLNQNTDDNDLSFILILVENIIRLMTSSMQATNNFQIITNIAIIIIYCRLMFMIVKFIPDALEQERNNAYPNPYYG